MGAGHPPPPGPIRPDETKTPEGVPLPHTLRAGAKPDYDRIQGTYDERTKPMGNAEYDKVMKALRKQGGMTQAEREEKARRLTMGEEQSKKFKADQGRVKKLRDKKRRGHGDDDVIDTGMFGS